MGSIIDINAGRLLIASDLHGNWKDYQRIRELYEGLKAQGRADRLILDGDLVHGYPGYEDRSVKILDDLMNNHDSSVMALLGNHELMHIYHMSGVAKNGHDLHDSAGPLEEQITGSRAKYVDFMKRMPYAVRT